MYESIEQIREANRERGHHFFDADTMRFFRSRVLSRIVDGRFFVTSEQFVSSTGAADARRYTIREALPDGDVVTAADSFQEYATAAQAYKGAEKLASVSYTERAGVSA